ncbi:AsmA family protein [Acidobacteria bacterium AH-259-D05]|nr:AsmA family protein [Acidobacteria bacterium AH-259-D05]
MKIVVGLVVVLIAFVAGGVFLINSYLQTPEFKELVLFTARERAGSEVEIDAMDVSVFRGIALQGMRIANPSGFRGEFLSADRLILRHRLLPLLQRQVEIDRLSVERPVLKLIQGEDERWNFRRLLNGRNESSATPGRAADESSAGGKHL